MDITTDFGSVILGSSPGGCTYKMSSVTPSIDSSRIPKEVSHVTSALKKAGFEAFLVGGCVRDLIRGVKPKDWDVTTNATPEEIIPLFEKTVYENNFGTVAVVVTPSTESEEKDLDSMLGKHETGRNDAKGVSHETQLAKKGLNTDVSRLPSTSPSLQSEDLVLDETPKEARFIVEVTPYRTETTYSDNRHPDAVVFSKNIEDDLERRDFTMNALAYDPDNGQIIDRYNGKSDIKDKVIRAVGDPSMRFQEDALRLLRAVRFSAELGFAIESATSSALVENSALLKNISEERIRDEFVKIIMSNDPMLGIGLLERYGLLEHIIPELREGIGCEQKGEHIYDVFEHCLHALQHAAEKGESLEIRLSALFHDIGKPRTRRWDGTKAGGKGKYTFYGHEVVGARMAKKILERLRFSRETVRLVESLVRNHMFFSDTEQITLSAVRRIINKVGKEHIWELMRVRECDRVGMKKKEAPYRLRKYHAMIDEALRDPISVSQLKVDGNILMGELHVKPGPRMGWILHALLEEVLDDPHKNAREYLDARVRELESLPDTELKALGEKGKETKSELEEEEIKKLHKKHGV